MKTSLIALGAILVLAGCATSAAEDTNDGYVKERHIVLEDGRIVTCLTFKANYAGGMSCDWQGAN